MMWFRNLKVRNKLLLSFALVVLLAVAAGTFALINMENINMSYGDAMDISGQRIDSIFTAKDHFIKARTTLRESYYPDNTRESLIGLTSVIEQELNSLTVSLKNLSAVASPAVQENITTVMPLVDRYRKDAEEVIGTLLAVDEISLDNPEYVAALLQAKYKTVEMGVTYADDMTAAMDILPTMSIDALNTLAVENNEVAQSALFISIGIYALVVAFSLLIALYVAGLIAQPLRALSTFMKKAGTTGNITLEPEDVKTIGAMMHVTDEIGMTIEGAATFIGHVTNIAQELDTIASGNLAAEVEMLSSADTMGKSMKEMVDNLNSMFGEIRASTDQVALGSKQVADGAHSLAQGSTEQAATVEELSSSMADIAGKTKENAVMAERAAELADSIRDKAERGTLQMNAMMDAVKDINQASQNISKVIKVIDDIAFQTNILALNAAVEAARAGQHGKGFAVVAEEVRNLAAKSAEAAKETSYMIANSMEKAELGSRIADETAASLGEIVTGVKESSELIGEIAKSSEQQSTGIGEINTGIDQVAQVIHQNSATAEESAAASQEMNGQTDMLHGLIAQFKLKEAIYV